MRQTLYPDDLILLKFIVNNPGEINKSKKFTENTTQQLKVPDLNETVLHRKYAPLIPSEKEISIYDRNRWL